MYKITFITSKNPKTQIQFQIRIVSSDVSMKTNQYKIVRITTDGTRLTSGQRNGGC